MTTSRHPAFSRIGVGGVLGNGFDAEVSLRAHCFPRGAARGRQLAIFADFGGQHRGQAYETYSFLICDLDRLQRWHVDQMVFRQQVLASRRRMAFKSMNDHHRRRALIPFLNMSDAIDGWLVTFMVSVRGGSMFRSSMMNGEAETLASSWRPAVREKLARVLHFSAFLLSGLSLPQQDVLWVIDQDDIAANDSQLTLLTKLLANVSGHYLSHDLRNLRCATTRSDDGTLALEDLASICDLAAGGLCELATSMAIDGRFPVGRIAHGLPKSLSWKSRWIATWMAVQGGPLHRHTWMIDLQTNTSAMLAQKISCHAMPGLLSWPAPG